MTTGSRPAPFRVPIRLEGKTGLILPDRIRALYKQRLVQRLGVADAGALRLTLDRLQEVFEP